MVEGKDPKEKLTNWLTQWGDEAGTRVMNKEHLEFIAAYGLSGSKEGLNIPLYKDIEERINRAMMATKGQRSNDVRDALISISDSENRDWGTRPAEEHVKRRRHENE